ncbi:MAG: NAD-dependent deacylase [Bacteroidetes bacterium]|nr:NAD-dependent deacylase [Bacteroidota bacterium]
MKKVVVFTGSGISAESGIKTFRDHDGLWENYKIEEVATPQAWIRDPGTVLSFYNMCRKEVIQARPNAAHIALADLETYFKVQIITQNIDDLHERAGSSNVLHLHGEITKARSSADASLIYPIQGWEMQEGALCPKGSLLRPHIVWFGEMVPMLPIAAELVSDADIFIVIGTSLAVYPAASLVDYAPYDCLKFLIDPSESVHIPGVEIIRSNAGTGVPLLVERLLAMDLN